MEDVWPHQMGNISAVAYLEHRQGRGQAQTQEGAHCYLKGARPKGRHRCLGRFWMTFFWENTLDGNFVDLFWEYLG